MVRGWCRKGCHSQWLWSQIVQLELDKFTDRINAHHVRHVKDKILPSGCSPNESYNSPAKFNGQNCLIPVETDVIDGLMQELGGEESLLFVSQEFGELCRTVYENIGSPSLSLHSGWVIFTQMLPHVHEM